MGCGGRGGSGAGARSSGAGASPSLPPSPPLPPLGGVDDGGGFARASTIVASPSTYRVWVYCKLSQARGLPQESWSCRELQPAQKPHIVFSQSRAELQTAAKSCTELHKAAQGFARLHGAAHSHTKKPHRVAESCTELHNCTRVRVFRTIQKLHPITEIIFSKIFWIAEL